MANHIPFLYEINANLIFIPGLGGKKDAVAGGFEVAFDGKGGFAATPKSAAPIKDMEASPNSIKEVTSSALAPHGVVLAVNAPKIAFSFGTASFMEAVHTHIPAAIKKSKSADGCGRVGHNRVCAAGSDLTLAVLARVAGQARL